jgi:hypothetical protein
VLTVGQHLDRAGGEPASVSGPAFLLESREADRASLAAATAGVAPVLQRPGQPVQAAAVGLLGILGPPGGDLMLSLISLSSQVREGPWDLSRGIDPTLLQPRLHEVKAPVVSETGRACVRCQGTLLARSGVEREPVGLGHCRHWGAILRSVTVSTIHNKSRPRQSAGKARRTPTRQPVPSEPGRASLRSTSTSTSQAASSPPCGSLTIRSVCSRQPQF